MYEVLTGRPPYYGANRDEILRRARRGDGAEALARLAQCGADAELVQLGCECLAAEREGRPRNAGVVAERLTAYQAEVRERLRQAELQRARAEVKALEERKRRRLVAALALAGMLLLSGGGVAWWQWQRRQSEADNAVLDVVKAAEHLREQAQADPLNAATYDKAVAAAQKAEDMAHTGGASAAVQRQASVLRTELQTEAEAAANDRQLLAALLDLHGPREGPKFRSEANGMMTALAEPTADEQFAAAFRRWGLELDKTTATEAVAMLKKRPIAVVTEVIAALDQWSSERWRSGKPWQRLAKAAALLDEQAGAKRRELRAILMRGRLPVEQAVDALSAALRPVPIALPIPLGPDRQRLRQLAEQTDPTAEPILGLLTLVRGLRVAGEDSLAERLLRSAIVARPREVVLHHTLGRLFMAQTPPRWREAVECFTAARVLRPDLGVNLAIALLHSGRDDEGLALLARLVQESPRNPYLHFQQAYYLKDKGRLDEAMVEYHQAIALDPKLDLPHNNLGVVLRDNRRLDEAIAEYRRAIALNPKNALAHLNLGYALAALGRLDEAMDEYRQAIALDPKKAQVHYNLGVTLFDKGRLDEAMDEYRQAIALDPKYAPAHANFGVALRDKGRLEEAIAELRRSIALDPKDAKVHTNLGTVLHDKGRWDEAIAEYRQAIALDPKYANPHGGLGLTLLQQGRFVEARKSTQCALELLPPNTPLWRWVRQLLHTCDRMLALEKQLSAILRGEASPADPGEALTLAFMCQQPYKKRYGASARLYADAFAAEPKRAADLNQQHRYNAACCAALAAAGQGNDTHLLPDKVAVMFRHWALGWLRDDLSAYAKLAERKDPKANQFIQQTLAHWRSDPDLASIRDPQALDRLPAHERAAWHALWHDVDALAKRTANK